MNTEAEMIHSILIIGQSNMAGRGFPSEVEPIVNKRLFVLRNGRWRSMYVPVNPDRSFSGINLAESFACRLKLSANTIKAQALQYSLKFFFSKAIQLSEALT